MISLQETLNIVEKSKNEYEELHEKWEEKVRKVYARFEITPIQTIFDDPNTRSVFRELLTEIFDIEYELGFDKVVESCSAQFMTLLGFDCECESCQHGPVIIEHMEQLKKEDEEWVKEHNCNPNHGLIGIKID